MRSLQAIDERGSARISHCKPVDSAGPGCVKYLSRLPLKKKVTRLQHFNLRDQRPKSVEIIPISDEDGNER